MLTIKLFKIYKTMKQLFVYGKIFIMKNDLKLADKS